MRKSISEIYDQACLEKASMSTLNGLLTNQEDSTSTLDTSQQLLTDLTSNSKVASWRLMLWIHSFITWVSEGFWEIFKADVEAIIRNSKPGVVKWYQQQAFLFQFGYNLSWNGFKYVYLSSDESSRIIKYCSVNDNGGIVRVKVATGADSPTQLNMEQETAITAYFKKVKHAGTKLIIINYPADRVKQAWKIYYNPLFQPAVVRANVEAAIRAYLKSIPFSNDETANAEGILIINDFIAAVRKAEGVKDAILVHCEIANITDPFTQVVEQYQSASGYYVISPLHPLNGFYDAPTNSIPVIQMIPYNV